MINVRRMTLDDAPKAFEIDKLSSVLYWPERSYHYELTENDASRCWGAYDENELRGFLVLWVIVDEAHVANFAIHPDFRQRGIGQSVLWKGLCEAWKDGARISFLEVRAGNIPALSLYKKFGYETVNVRKAYYQDNHEDALLMNLSESRYLELVSSKLGGLS